MDFDEIFPDNREKGENLIKQCQLVMLRMLKILDSICLKFDIKYFLVGGSLLGAIRHKGFIPWDDDLDIGMTRENYEKFLKLGVKELPKDIFFQTTFTDKKFPQSDFVDAKLRDKYSSYKHIGRKNNPWHEGLQIDIFVYDKAYLPFNFFIIFQNFLLNIFNNYTIKSKILKWISKKSPFKLVYASNYLKSFGMLGLGKNYIKRTEISRLIRVDFEDMKVYIPCGWNECLLRQYGDYMKIPDSKKRVSHHNVQPDPFEPCNHNEILIWKNRKLLDLK